MKHLKKKLIFVFTSAILAIGLVVGASASYAVVGAAGNNSSCPYSGSQNSACISGSGTASCPTINGGQVIIGSDVASAKQAVQNYLQSAGQNASCSTQNTICAANQNSGCPASSGNTVSAASQSASQKTDAAAKSAATESTKAAAAKNDASTASGTTAASAANTANTASNDTAAVPSATTSSCNTGDTQTPSKTTSYSGSLLEYIGTLLKKCGIDPSKLGIQLPDETTGNTTQQTGGTDTASSGTKGTTNTGSTETPASPSDSTGASSKNVDNLSFEEQVVALVNEQRAANGLKPLTLSTELSNAARAKSQDMHDKKYFAHESPTYGSPFEMLTSFGISYRSAGENIAMGYSTPEAVMNAWMNSSGHRANILNASYTKIGVGYVADGNYWTQEFIG